ncbi:MAG TPA: phosphatase PAP2 family protein [Vicinamibacteria bacterium]|nr:phosphatase PAP2 family protein [Vicinamibacteria bacterium]
MRAHRLATSLAAALVATTLASVGCSKDIPTQETLTPSSPSGADANAGTWRMIVLNGPTQFEVPAPAPTSSEAYQAELAAIKSAQATLTDAQRQAIDYWAGGGVLRWNQVMRELVARYNLPPAPRDNGTYVFPDANNPFADPQFPFANPPYSARAYSYVSVAQFEALKAAWYYKFLYNRPAPSQVDGGVAALLPASGVPSYPSEDAVLSGVSTEMLKLLFPAALEEITLKAGQQREAALLGGRATASDIAAGLALGRAVAAVLVARAGADGMGAAVGTPAQWQALADGAAARGEVPWKSLESPARPPMLPNFGKVRAWMMTPTDVVNERPPAPPSTSSAQMTQELAEVKRTSDELTRDQLAIAQKWNDGAGTYTPPGHWNDIATEYVRDARFSEVRAARVFALLNMAMHDGAVGCWDAKYAWFNPRPSQLDPDIKTKIGLPNFPAYPSGHSTFSAAATAVLSYLFPSGSASFESLRDEAGISRLYGAIHYRSDIDEGKTHGARMGGYTVAFARKDGAD